MILKNKIYTFPIFITISIITIFGIAVYDYFNGMITIYQLILHILIIFLISLGLEATIVKKDGEYLEIKSRNLFFKKKEYIRLKEIKEIKTTKKLKNILKKSNFVAVTNEIEMPITSFDFNIFLSKDKIEEFINKKD